jgi:GTP-binding protein EngB required for normal cell division
MVNSRIEIIKWTTDGNSLLIRARQALDIAHNGKVRELAARVPGSIVETDQQVTVVFAGQYSAGKSTIIKVLTGRGDIATGAAITTQSAHCYEWEKGVSIIDTPGVHTVLQSDHDEVTYRAIADADLLVFVITNELFDSDLSQHFRKLAIEREKAHEMMLVVNKMRRCAKGNSHEAQAVICEDLRKILAPFTPDDLRTSFVDAESAIESRNESDRTIADLLWRKSGIDNLTSELNQFIRDKGVAGRYTTALYALEQVLQEALGSETTGDTDVDGWEELQLQRRRMLVDAQDRIPQAVGGVTHEVAAKIRQEGRALAEMITASVDRKELDRELQTAQQRVEQYAETLERAVVDVISKQMEELSESVAAIANGELVKELLPRLTQRIKEASVSPATLPKLKQASELSSQFGQFLVRNSYSGTASSLSGLAKLNQYSGTATHGAVKWVGNFFGKSFKPWEAVRWTRGIANAGRFLGVAGALITVLLQWKEDADAAQLEHDLRESRTALRGGFSDAAYQIEMHYDSATKTYVVETLTAEIGFLDRQLAEIREMQRSKSELFRILEGLLGETREMIRGLHMGDVGVST